MTDDTTDYGAIVLTDEMRINMAPDKALMRLRLDLEKATEFLDSAFEQLEIYEDRLYGTDGVITATIGVHKE